MENLNHKFDKLLGDMDRLDKRFDKIGQKMDTAARQRRTDTLTSIYTRRGFAPERAETYARTEARREAWGEDDERRVRKYCELIGLDFNSASGYAAAVSAVSQDKDLVGSIDPVLLRLADTGGDPRDFAAYSAAAGEIYMNDPATCEMILKPEFSHYSRKEG